MSDPHVVLRPLSLSPENAQAARVRALAYVFECFHRHTEKKAAPASGPEDARKDQDART